MKTLIKKANQKYSAQIAGFTLIELLIVIAIIALLMAISTFGLAGARQSARDGRRKSDIESIRSALELYRADCDQYPASITAGGVLRGGPGNTGRCSTANVYMQVIPTDPGSAAYRYVQLNSGASYEICATLEQRGSATAQSCGGSTTCGSGNTCYHKAVSP